MAMSIWPTAGGVVVRSSGTMVSAASLPESGGWEGTCIAPQAGSSANLSRTLAAGLPLLV